MPSFRLSSPRHSRPINLVIVGLDPTISGRVPRVRTYPRGCQLSLEDAEGNLILSPIDEE